MGLCVYYRSLEPMHPALAFAISESADQLNSQYAWTHCEPVVLSQCGDGHLVGQSEIEFSSEPADPGNAHSLPEGILMTVVELLCRLSADHQVDWEFGDDYDIDPIGQIHCGVADEELMEQIETLDGIGDLLEELDATYDLEEKVDLPGKSSDCSLYTPSGVEPSDPQTPADEPDDEGPRFLKFPGSP